ncbi:hypothetical protein D3C81_1852110 [compost metagenome]
MLLHQIGVFLPLQLNRALKLVHLRRQGAVHLAVILHDLIHLQITLHQLMLKLQDTLLPLINHLVQILQILVQPLHMPAGMGQPVLQLMIGRICMCSGLDDLLHSKNQIE